MAAGHYGEHGLRAQRLVGLEAKYVIEPVPIPRQSMEECALDRVFKQRLVGSKIALVSCQCLLFKLNTRLHESAAPKKQNLHGKN